MSTASAAAATAIDPRIAGKTPSAAKPLYSSVDHVAPAYVRNTGCWAADLVQQLTCIGVWNSQSGAGRGFTAIHPELIACAEHFRPNIGDTVRFVTAANVVVTRTVIGLVNLAGTDQTVARVDSPLPDTITPALVLPPDWLNYFRLRGLGVPVLSTDDEGKALVADLVDISRDAAVAGGTIPTLVAAPSDATRLGFYEVGTTGDSGQGVYLILSGRLVLLFCHEDPSSGPSFAHNYARVNAMLASTFGAGYALTPIDMSGFDIECFGLAGVLTVYFVPRSGGDKPYGMIYSDLDSTIWNGSAFENYVRANLATYQRPLCIYGNGHRTADFPGGIAAGTPCTIRIREQLTTNGAPTEDDLTLRTYFFTPGGTAVSVAPSGIGPSAFASTTIVPKVQTVLDPVTGGSGGGAAGSGADQCTLTITASGSPVADADVWVTSDSAGRTVVAGTLQTDSNGHITFLLDAGDTYYLFMEKDGVNPIVGRQFTAVAD